MNEPVTPRIDEVAFREALFMAAGLTRDVPDSDFCRAIVTAYVAALPAYAPTIPAPAQPEVHAGPLEPLKARVAAQACILRSLACTALKGRPELFQLLQDLDALEAL